MHGKVNSVLTGKIATFGPKEEPSAYRKQVCDAPQSVGFLGFTNDDQADRKHHGGVDKAVLQYASEHYATWIRERPELHPELQAPGAFGENIASSGMTESSVCIGDCYRIGSALVEVSQARQPCWKLGHRFGDAAMVNDVVNSGYCGWYYRVLEVGVVAAGDVIELQDRVNPQWPVDVVFELLVGGGRDQAALKSLSKLDALSGNWQARARRKLRNLRSRSN